MSIRSEDEYITRRDLITDSSYSRGDFAETWRFDLECDGRDVALSVPRELAAACRSFILANSTGYFFAANIRTGQWHSEDISGPASRARMARISAGVSAQAGQERRTVSVSRFWKRMVSLILRVRRRDSSREQCTSAVTAAIPARAFEHVFPQASLAPN